MKKVLYALFTAFFVFCILSLFSIGMSHFYFQNGLTAFHDSQDREKWQNYTANIAKSISCFEYALAFNRLGIFDRYYMYDIYYYLSHSYWNANDTDKAKANINTLVRKYAKNIDKKRRDELDLLQARTGIVVNGLMDDGWRAIVNQNMVKKGDRIDGILVADITDEYLVFQYKDYLFTDSVDRANPLVMQGITEISNLIDSLSESADENYKLLDIIERTRVRAQTLISDYALDKPDLVYIEKSVVAIDDALKQIENMRIRLNHKKEVLEGMNSDEIIAILGQAKEINFIYEAEERQKWLYDDRTLIFKQTNEGLILEKIIKDYSEI